jgi:hypothetical protein
MTSRGKLAAAGLACATVAAGATWLWSSPNAARQTPTPEQIKVSAQAALDASLRAGSTVRQVMLETGKTPSDELCQAVWDRKPRSEQRGLLYAEWMHGCADAPQ